MTNQSTIASSCLSRLSERVRINGLPRPTSTAFSTPVRAIAQISAACLVIASTGLGGYYAWTIGYSHGALLAGLFVAFAVGLELAKPLAVATAFAAFRSWALARGVVLAVLALVAIAYSLTAELSLTAMTRGDLVATREASVRSRNDADGDRKRAIARYDAALAELATLAGGRPAREIQAEIDSLLLRPGANNCTVIDGRVTREVCPKVAELRKDLARAERRVELEAVIATPLPIARATEADEGHSIKDADPGARALSTYLALLGIVIAPAVLGEWLVLVPVLALEVGSAFAGVLVQSVSGPRVVQASVNRKQPVVQPVVQESAVQVVHADETSPSEGQATTLATVKNQIVRQLASSGGSKVASERGLAKLIGTSKPTARRALQSLVLAGVIAAEAGRNGTLLRLVA